MGQSKKLVLDAMRLSYANLVTPRAGEGSKTPKYSVSILIPKSDTKAIKEINDAIQSVIDANQDTLKTKKGLKLPLRDGDAERDDAVYAGHMFMNASSTIKPMIVDRDRKEIIDEREIYSGMYGRVSVNVYAFNKEGNKGVALGLNAVQKVKDGESLGGTYTEDAMNEDFAKPLEEEGDPLLG